MKILKKLCIVCGKEFIKPKTCSLVDWFGGKKRPQGKKTCSRSCADKNKKGKPSWNKGVKTGFIPSTAFKKGQRSSPITEFKKGIPSWNKNRSWTEEERKNISENSYWKGKYGEQSSNWRGGTTKFGQLMRSMNVYRSWRESIFKRDNWTCVMCAARCEKGKAVYLHVDHIKPFYKIIEENRIETIQQAKDCKELWDISNGRTLCILCHKQTPSYLRKPKKSKVVLTPSWSSKLQQG